MKESTSLAMDIVSPKKSTTKKPEMPVKTEKVDTPRKSPRISQNVDKEAALPAKLVMPEIDCNKICEGSNKKEKKYFTIMHGGKPVKIYVLPEGVSDSEGPVNQSSAKENSDKSAESSECKESVKEKDKEVKDSLSISNGVSGIYGEPREMIEMMNKTSEEVSVSDTEEISDEQSENEENEKETSDKNELCVNNKGESADDGEMKEGEKSQEETEDSEEGSYASSDKK